MGDEINEKEGYKNEKNVEKILYKFLKKKSVKRNLRNFGGKEFLIFF
jgi:hypothetical protein